MIVVDLGDRVWRTYCRTNKRVRWEYADYGGRWSSIEEAKAKIAEHYPKGTKVQYSIDNMTTDEVIIGEMIV